MKTTKIICGAILAMTGLLALLGVAGARLNTTSSLPEGLYWTTGAKPQKGDIVIFCPPRCAAIRLARARAYLAGGFCPGGNGTMMKQIAAVAGDRVVISDCGVRVGGIFLRNSEPLSEDPKGRPLPRLRGDFTLKSGQVLLMSQYNPLSFDGRYFGPSAASAVKSVVRPVYTWNVK